MADFGCGPIVVAPPAGPVAIAPPVTQPVLALPVAGPQGPPGGVQGPYTLTAVSNWTQVHTFGYDPEVQVVDASGATVLKRATYPDSTHVNLTFPQPFTGEVTLR